jgi:DNA-binding NarL/FixJ family response regulator
MQGVTILVVDDDSSTRRSVADALGGGAGELTAADSCLAARKLGGTFDVGVFGIELGDASGVDLAEELLHEGRVGQVVFFSGAMWQAPLRRAAALGPVFPKDGDPAELAAELRRIVTGTS